MKANCSLILSITMAALSLVGRVEGRAFTDNNGRTIEAEVLELRGDQVRIRRSDGKEFAMAVSSFSEQDQQYLRTYSPPPKIHVPKVSALGISDAHGEAEYKSGADTFDEGKFWVYVPESYHADTPTPMVVSSHGNIPGVKHQGQEQLKRWKKYADQHGFILVCPSYDVACSQGKDYHGNDYIKCYNATRDLIEKMMPMLFGAFNVDRRCVLMTGYSGGGHATWISMDYPDYFSALAFRNANYSPLYSDKLDARNLRKWKGRPICCYNGAQDEAIKEKEAQGARTFLKNHAESDRLKIEELPGVGHISLNAEAAEWFVSEVVKKAGTSSAR